ncbi:hypothetical protein RF11_09550 [Thelohanellus kitauei]|uniref:Uncharacterized protein n=1 Tax=Thelohanellus kitauei TaxID=669202 RepID=A0A0C2MWZ7_THEKT|nr:hypothetical protein RF11_09550 [Thelohanellus kitauei]
MTKKHALVYMSLILENDSITYGATYFNLDTDGPVSTSIRSEVMEKCLSLQESYTFIGRKNENPYQSMERLEYQDSVNVPSKTNSDLTPPVPLLNIHSFSDTTKSIDSSSVSDSNTNEYENIHDLSGSMTLRKDNEHIYGVAYTQRSEYEDVWNAEQKRKDLIIKLLGLKGFLSDNDSEGLENHYENTDDLSQMIIDITIEEVDYDDPMSSKYCDPVFGNMIKKGLSINQTDNFTNINIFSYCDEDFVRMMEENQELIKQCACFNQGSNQDTSNRIS